MTAEQRKWYLAGVADMEAGRLVTTSKPWAARKEVHYFDADDNRIGGDRIVLGPALTAEEAKAAMLGLEEIWKDFLPHSLESSSLDDAESAYAKLSLISNGENE